VQPTPTSAQPAPEAQLIHFPKSCLHCEDAPCVTVCPTGASYKRVEDGIVLVNESDCIGCGLCAWACPYGAREMDQEEKVMKKCTLCVARILPPRPKDALPEFDVLAPFLEPVIQEPKGFLGWLDKALEKI
jgi:Fe-S-cluster-containing dehydrogenase component